MDFKKVGIVVGLVVVIVIAAVITASRTKGSGTSNAVQTEQQKMMAVKGDKIDDKTYEIISERVADWNSKYAPDSSGHYKNPKTGEYTISDVTTCVSCGEKIPAPVIPPVPANKGIKAQREGIAVQQQIMRDYKCPKCGKNAYSQEQVEEK
jgi:rRNA maturation protein Nop10